MAYIGKQPVIGNFVKLDAISVVNGQASYTMQNGGANFTEYANVNQFLVSLNGILQSPTTSFAVSGSTITFASNLVTGDVIDFIIVLGNTLDVGVPSDNTVSLAKLTATGTKDATTFLRGDNTFAEAGGGKVLQVASVNWGGASGTTSGTYIQADSNFEVSLTPSSTSNKILILMGGGNIDITGSAQMEIGMFRKIGAGSFTEMTITDVDGNTSVKVGYQNLGFTLQSHSFNYLDSPNTTSAVTYSPYYRSRSGTVYFNNTESSNNWNVNLTIMEIQG